MIGKVKDFVDYLIDVTNQERKRTVSNSELQQIAELYLKKIGVEIKIT